MEKEIRILLADDEVHFLESLTKVLTVRKFVVHVACNGREVLEALRRERFDVIVLDIKMPVLDGISTLREIRRNDQLTPVLLLTGHAAVSLVSEALKSGGTDYLCKPCSVNELVSAIENALERRAIEMEIAEKKNKKKPGQKS